MIFPTFLLKKTLSEHMLGSAKHFPYILYLILKAQSEVEIIIILILQMGKPRLTEFLEQTQAPTARRR